MPSSRAYVQGKKERKKKKKARNRGLLFYFLNSFSRESERRLNESLGTAD